MMSGKSFFLLERRARKRMLLEMIEAHPDLLLGRLKALFSMKTGVSFKKIDEYLRELEEGGLVEFEGDHVKVVK